MVQIILSPPLFPPCNNHPVSFIAEDGLLESEFSQCHSKTLTTTPPASPWLPFSHQIAVKHFIADNFRPSKGTCTTRAADPATLQVRWDVQINKTYLEMFLPKRFYDFILTLVIDFSTMKQGRSWNDLQLKLHISMFLVALFTRNAWHIKNVTCFCLLYWSAMCGKDLAACSKISSAKQTISEWI